LVSVVASGPSSSALTVFTSNAVGAVVALDDLGDAGQELLGELTVAGRVAGQGMQVALVRAIGLPTEQPGRSTMYRRPASPALGVPW